MTARTHPHAQPAHFDSLPLPTLQNQAASSLEHHFLTPKKADEAGTSHKQRLSSTQVIKQKL